jgi:hypothetical protein
LIRLQIGINRRIARGRFLGRRRWSERWNPDGKRLERAIEIGFRRPPDNQGGYQEEHDKMNQDGTDKKSPPDQFVVPDEIGAIKVSPFVDTFRRRFEFGDFQRSLRLNPRRPRRAEASRFRKAY